MAAIRMASSVRTLVLAATLTAATACSDGPTATAPPSLATAQSATAAPLASPSTRPTTSQPSARLDEKLTLADGRTIAARCLGEGTPTILLEAGGSNDMGDWQAQFVTTLARSTTTCLYSRAGGPGSSPPSVSPPTMASVTADAFEVLDIAKAMAGVEGPYLFVGSSLGGSVVLAEALTRPDQTVGVAILDTDFPTDFLEACRADGRSADDCQEEYDGDIDAKQMEAQIADAVHPLDVPAVLVSAMEYPDCVDTPSATLSANIAGTTVVAADCAGLAEAIADKQIADWPAAFPRIEQTRVEADHDGLVVSEGREIAGLILQMIELARVGG